MTQIDTAGGIVTLVNTFTVEPERQSELLDILDVATREVMSGFPGFISANLHVSLDGTRVLNYAQWRDAECLHRAINDPAFRPHYEACNAISSAEPLLYRVASVEESDRDVRPSRPSPSRPAAAGFGDLSVVASSAEAEMSRTFQHDRS